MTCALCKSTKSRTHRRFRNLPICQICARRIMKYRRLPQDKADAKARMDVTSVMCMVLARRGLDDALDAAVLLWNVLEPE